jgi:hypothetical protein
MITLKCIKPIKDSSVNRNRLLNEVFEVTPERAVEMEKNLNGKFNQYFIVQKVAKKVSSKKNANSKNIRG